MGFFHDVDALGRVTAYAYDAASRLTSLTDPVGNVTSWTHDDAGRVATETDPLGKVTTHAHDLVGNLTQTTDRMGRVARYSYDDDDRLAAATWLPAGGGAAVDSVAYDYDDAGRLVRVRDGASEYAYDYDAADRLISVDDQGTTGLPQVTLTYDYDGAGDRTGLADSEGGLTAYDYDVRGRLTRIVQSGAGVADKRVDFAYDGDGRVTGIDRYSDQAGTAEVVATSYSYDQASRATRIEHQVPNSGSGSGGSGSGSGGYGSGSGSGVGGPLASYAYAYDPGGRTTGEDRTWDSGASSDSSTYEYTDDGQLLAVLRGGGGSGSGGYGSGSGGYGSGSGSGSGPGGPTVAEAFGYDANGNRNTAGYSTGTGNRLASDGVYSYAYDDEGELVSRTETATGDRTLYKWDVRGRLVEVDSKVGGVTTVLASYAYDALDRRIGVAEGGATTWTVYDGNAPLLDFDGSGALKARYLDGPSAAGVDAVLARETPTGGTAWYLRDRLGSVRDVVNNSGVVIDHVEYNAFGGVESETSPAAGDRLVGFAGLVRDVTVGLNLAVYRVMDPATGLWLREDPIGFDAGDPNLQRYAGNAPTLYFDPSGLDFGMWIGKPGYNFGPPSRRPTKLPTKVPTALTPGQKDYLKRLIDNIGDMIRECNLSPTDRQNAQKIVDRLKTIDFYINADSEDSHTPQGVYRFNRGTLYYLTSPWIALSTEFFNSGIEEQTRTLLHEGYHATFEPGKYDFALFPSWRPRPSESTTFYAEHYAEDYARELVKILLQRCGN